jgi:hypothetical protein
VGDDRRNRQQSVTIPPLARPTVVPHIASWEAERVSAELILKPFGRGIGYADERVGDRDRHGVLWRRTPSRVGRGRPEYRRVHARRQREVMTDLRCQVCAGPASTRPCASRAPAPARRRARTCTALLWPSESPIRGRGA